MKVTYIKIFLDYLDAIEPLGDAERGRLFTALMQYAKSGEVPQLSGNERFVFPSMKAQIDRDIKAMEDTAQNKSKAGRASAEARKRKGHCEQSPKGKIQQNATESTGVESVEQNQQVLNLLNRINKDKDEDEDKDKDNKERKPPKGGSREKRERFSPPSVDDVREYCAQRGNHVDPELFVDYYTANGWTQGKGKPIKSWKACVNTWEKRDEERVQESHEKKNRFQNYEQRDIDYDALVDRMVKK